MNTIDLRRELFEQPIVGVLDDYFPIDEEDEEDDDIWW